MSHIPILFVTYTFGLLLTVAVHAGSEYSAESRRSSPWSREMNVHQSIIAPAWGQYDHHHHQHRIAGVVETMPSSDTESNHNNNGWMPIEQIQAMAPLVQYAQLCLYRPGQSAVFVDRRLLSLSDFCTFSEGSQTALLRQELFDLINNSDIDRRRGILHDLFFLNLKEDSAALLLQQCGHIIGRDLIQYAVVSSDLVHEFLSFTFDSISDQTYLLISALHQVEIGEHQIIKNLIMSSDSMSFPHLIADLILNPSIIIAPITYQKLAVIIMENINRLIVPTWKFICALLSLLEALSDSIGAVNDCSAMIPSLLCSTVRFGISNHDLVDQYGVAILCRVLSIMTRSRMRPICMNEQFLDQICPDLLSLLISDCSIYDSERHVNAMLSESDTSSEIVNLESYAAMITIITHLYYNADSFEFFQNCKSLRTVVQAAVERFLPEHQDRIKFMTSMIGPGTPSWIPILLMDLQQDTVVHLIKTMFNTHCSVFRDVPDEDLDQMTNPLQIFAVFSKSHGLYLPILKFVSEQIVFENDNDRYFAFITLSLLRSSSKEIADMYNEKIEQILGHTWFYTRMHEMMVTEVLLNLTSEHVLRILPGVILEVQYAKGILQKLSSDDLRRLQQQTLTQHDFDFVLWIDVFYDFIVQDIADSTFDAVCEKWQAADIDAGLFRSYLSWMIWCNNHEELLSTEDLLRLLQFDPSVIPFDADNEDMDYNEDVLDHKAIARLIIRLVALDELQPSAWQIPLLRNVLRLSNPIEIYEFIHLIYNVALTADKVDKCRIFIASFVYALAEFRPRRSKAALSVTNADAEMVVNIVSSVFFNVFVTQIQSATNSMMFCDHVISFYKIIDGLPYSHLLTSLLQNAILTKMITISHLSDSERVLLILWQGPALKSDFASSFILDLIFNTVHHQPNVIYKSKSLFGQILQFLDSIIIRKADHSDYFWDKALYQRLLSNLIPALSWSCCVERSTIFHVLSIISNASITLVKDAIVTCLQRGCGMLSDLDKSALGAVLFYLIFSTSSTGKLFSRDMIMLGLCLECSVPESWLSHSRLPVDECVRFVLQLLNRSSFPASSMPFFFISIDRFYTWMLLLPPAEFTSTFSKISNVLLLLQGPSFNLANEVHQRLCDRISALDNHEIRSQVQIIVSRLQESASSLNT